jgi:hypothetical protein
MKLLTPCTHIQLFEVSATRILVQRLNKRRLEDPSKYAILTNIAEEEKEAGQQASSTSCCKGLLWLTRYGQVSESQAEKPQPVARSIAVVAVAQQYSVCDSYRTLTPTTTKMWAQDQNHPTWSASLQHDGHLVKTAVAHCMI